MEKQIELGDKVKCKITGFVGIATVRSEFINGCVQYEVAGKVGKDNKIPESVGIDEGSLEVISKRKKLIKKKDTGGPNSGPRCLRGF